MSRIARIFDAFRSIRVGVIGDVMLDTYCWGRVERISPEAPVPVVEVGRREHRLGGAGNVTLNLSRLGARVSVLSVIGADAEGEALRGLFRDLSIDDSHLLSAEDRITTQKTRIIASNQQMMRLDSEMSSDLSEDWEDRLLEAVTAYLDKESPQLMIFEDYDKGVLTDRLIHRAVDACRARGVISAVDPKKRHFLSYAGVDIFKPNLKEVREGLGIPVDPADTATLDVAHAALSERLGHRFSLITLSEHGIYHAGNGRSYRIPTHRRNISDVSGAGDTVIAVASLVHAVTGDMALAAEMANIAGGIVCEEVGTVAITRERLEAECQRLMSDVDGEDAGRRP